MNRTPILVLLLAALSTVACKTTSPGSHPTPSGHAQSSSPVNNADPTSGLITTFGEHRIGNTVVEASQSDGKITVKHLSSKSQPLGGKSISHSSMSPGQWPLHDGWFAYAQQNGVYVWLYNGSDKLLLVERKETPAQNSTSLYSPHNSPIPIPTAILKHIKEPFRSNLIRN